MQLLLEKRAPAVDFAEGVLRRLKQGEPLSRGSGA